MDPQRQQHGVQARDKAVPEALATPLARVRHRIIRRNIVRAAIAGAAAGSGLGALGMAAMFAWTATEGPQPAFSQYGYWAAPVALGVIFGALAGLRRVTDLHAAAWADNVAGGDDAASAALNAQGELAPLVAARAQEVLSRAARARGVTLGVSRPVRWALGFLVMLGGLHGITLLWTPPTATKDDIRPPSLLAALPLASKLLGASEPLLNAASKLGFEDFAKSVQQANKLAEMLEEGGLTQGQALAELDILRDKAAEEFGGEKAAAMLATLAENPELLKLAGDFAKGLDLKALAEEAKKTNDAAGHGRESTADKAAHDSARQAAEQMSKNMDMFKSLSPEQLAKLAQAFGVQADKNATPEDKTRQDAEMAKLLESLGKDNPLLKQLGSGSLNTEQAQALLRAHGEFQRRTDLMEDAVKGKPGAADAMKAAAAEPLLKDLPVVPATAPRDKPVISGESVMMRKATGRELETAKTDYRTQAHRLPRDVREAAEGYYGQGTGNKDGK